MWEISGKICTVHISCVQLKKKKALLYLAKLVAGSAATLKGW